MSPRPFRPGSETGQLFCADRLPPSPDHYDVLRWIHRELRPKRYVEIGVDSGKSLALVEPPTIGIGIDPDPKCKHIPSGSVGIVQTTSGLFFQLFELKEFLGENHFSLAFIDGLHLFEQTVEDLLNLERYAREDSLVAVHDTIPLNAISAARQPRTGFYTGDVWKLIPFLRIFRPHLEIVTVPCAPSGLTLIRGFRPELRISLPALAKQVRAFMQAPLAYRNSADLGSGLCAENMSITRWLRREESKVDA